MAKRKSENERKLPGRKQARRGKATKPFLPMCRCLTCGDWYRQPVEYMRHPKLDCPPCVKRKNGPTPAKE